MKTSLISALRLGFAITLFHWPLPNLVITLQAQEPENNIAEPASETALPQQSADSPDWAKQYLADDPLVKKDKISLEDIRSGMESPTLRSSIIVKYFDRVNDASNEDKLKLLEDALTSEHPILQQQSAVKLKELGKLKYILRRILLEFLKSETTKLQRAAIVGLEHVDIPFDEQSPEYWQSLIEGVSDEDNLVSAAAKEKLLSHEDTSIPYLLNVLKAQPSKYLIAAEILSDILERTENLEEPQNDTATREDPSKTLPSLPSEVIDDFFGEKGFSEIPPPSHNKAATAAPPPTIGKGKGSESAKSTPRNVDADHPTLVTVFYGTNRELIERPKPGWFDILPYPFIASLLLLAAITFTQVGPKETDKPHGCSRWVVPIFMIFGVAWALMAFRTELQQHWRIGEGPSYGPRRDPTEMVHYGSCEVSIPPTHDVGAVERPTIGPENEREHVVLKKTEELEEETFFQAIRDRLSSIPKEDKSCFVFIHGFNVDFENAARRTAQIHFDLKFQGVPIFFSWPSRANVRHYFSDRNEIEFSRYVIKQFLTDVADRSDAKRIHVIAHSMGADATCRAIAEMGEKGKIFDQIVLAAPDIDREVFRRQIAPRLTKTANRTTLYCSKNDLALLLSRNFNDSMRAGDSSTGALVLQDVDTVDASDIDTDLLGHSYYGDCLPLLNDVHELLQASLSPEERKLRPWPVDEGLQYWTLPDTNSQKPR
jgi:esterase/lipase superfamily enzyme